jgi:anti-anti-sigma factor
VVLVKGELDSQASSHLRELIEKLVVRGHKRIILDMVETRFSEFTAVALFSGGLRRLHRAGVEVAIQSHTPGTLALLQRIGLGNLTVVDSGKECLSGQRDTGLDNAQCATTICLEERHAVLEMIDSLHAGVDPQTALEQVNLSD